jgi:arylsulfatase A
MVSDPCRIAPASRRLFFTLAALMGGCGSELASEPTSERASPGPPNLILIFADDLGYGDLGAYGAMNIATPHLDRLAAEGARFTQAYSGNSVCTPSRAVIMTGRHGARQQLEGTNFGVYFPSSKGGMSPKQVTLAEPLRDAGYATSHVGKWHLGHKPDFQPTKQGFERLFGIPYSNDMTPLPLQVSSNGDWPETIDDVTDLEKQADLTRRYTDAIREHMRDAVKAHEPFFVYHATHVPHVPLSPSSAFVGTNASCESLDIEQACGAYADQVSELDHSVGAILDELDSLGVADNTVVVFTSDNGPWLMRNRDGGSAGALRGGKGTTFEGGLRVPLIIRWPGTVEPGRVIDEPVVQYDLFPTFLGAAGIALPDDRVLDGFDLASLLGGSGPRDPSAGPFTYLFMRLDNETPGAFRFGDFKLKFAVTDPEAPYAPERHDELLFDLATDAAETTDILSENTELTAELSEQANALLSDYLDDALR